MPIYFNNWIIAKIIGKFTSLIDEVIQACKRGWGTIFENLFWKLSCELILISTFNGKQWEWRKRISYIKLSNFKSTSYLKFTRTLWNFDIINFKHVLQKIFPGKLNLRLNIEKAPVALFCQCWRMLCNLRI